VLDNLFKALAEPTTEPTTEQTAKDWDVTSRMDRQRIHPHLRPETDTLELDALAVWCPFNAAHQGSELSRDASDGHLEAPLSVLECAAVLHRQIEYRHSGLRLTS
jgi:hypothetical protein